MLLNAKLRDKTKKVNYYRRQAMVPGVVYGPKIKPIAIAVDYKEFDKVFREAGESLIIKLKIDGLVDEYDVLIQHVDIDPLTRKFIHIDFYNVPMDEEISATIPLVFVGESEAVKNLNGVLIKNIQEIKVSCLPKDLPKEIKVDISPLKTFDDNIKISDLNIPANIKINFKPEDIVASVVPSITEEEIKELEKEATEVISEIEVVGKEKEEVEEKKEEVSKKE